MSVPITSNNASKFSEFILNNMVDGSNVSNITKFNDELVKTIDHVCRDALKNCSLSLTPGTQRCSFLGSKDSHFEFEIGNDLFEMGIFGDKALFSLFQSKFRSHYLVTELSGRRTGDTAIEIYEDKIKLRQGSVRTVEKIEDQAKILNHFKTSLTDFMNRIAAQQKAEAQANDAPDQHSSRQNSGEAKPDSGEAKPDSGQAKPDSTDSARSTGTQIGLLAGISAIGVALGFVVGRSKQKNESVKTNEPDTQGPKPQHRAIN